MCMCPLSGWVKSKCFACHRVSRLSFKACAAHFCFLRSLANDCKLSVRFSHPSLIKSVCVRVHVCVSFGSFCLWRSGHILVCVVLLLRCAVLAHEQCHKHRTELRQGCYYFLLLLSLCRRWILLCYLSEGPVHVRVCIEYIHERVAHHHTTGPWQFIISHIHVWIPAFFFF